MYERSCSWKMFLNPGQCLPAGREELTAHRHRSGFIFRRGKPTNPVIETLLDRSSDFVAAGHLRMSRCRFEGVRCRYITCEKTAHCTGSLCSD